MPAISRTSPIPAVSNIFCGQVLDYPDEQFDGVLAWDLLEYMEPALLSAAIDRLSRILKPKGYLLAFFHSDERMETVPCYSFRIEDMRTLQVSEYGKRAPPSYSITAAWRSCFRNSNR